MTWAQRLKRVFKIAIETCEACGGTMQVIAAIEAPGVIKRMLAPLDNRQGAGSDGVRLRVHPHARTPGLTRPRHSAARAAFDWRRLRPVQIRPMPRTFSRLGQAAQRIFLSYHHHNGQFRRRDSHCLSAIASVHYALIFPIRLTGC